MFSDVMSHSMFTDYLQLVFENDQLIWVEEERKASLVRGADLVCLITKARKSLHTHADVSIVKCKSSLIMQFLYLTADSVFDPSKYLFTCTCNCICATLHQHVCNFVLVA